MMFSPFKRGFLLFGGSLLTPATGHASLCRPSTEWSSSAGEYPQQRTNCTPLTQNADVLVLIIDPQASHLHLKRALIVLWIWAHYMHVPSPGPAPTDGWHWASDYPPKPSHLSGKKKMRDMRRPKLFRLLIITSSYTCSSSPHPRRLEQR